MATWDVLSFLLLVRIQVPVPFLDELDTYSHTVQIPRTGETMKITESQLRKLVKEFSVDKWKQQIVSMYQQWVKDEGHITPAASSVMATYFREKEAGPDALEVLTSHFGIETRDVIQDLHRQRRERKIQGLSEAKLKKVIREVISKKAMRNLKDDVADAAIKRSGIGNYATGVSVREDKNFHVQWDTEYAFRVTVRGGYGEREVWIVVGDIETGKVRVAGPAF